MKKKIIFSCCFILVFIGAIVLPKKAFKTASIKNTMTLEELQALPIQVKYVEDIESWNEDFFSGFCQEQLDGAEKCGNIFKVTPTGNIYINYQLIMEEAKIESVIKGTCTDKTIWLKNGLAATVEYDGKNVMLDGMDRSFMQKGCEYLVFVEEEKTNPYSERKVYTEQENMWFGCLNITRDSDTVVDGDGARYDVETEFYANDKKIIDCYNETKKVLMEKWLKN